MGLLNRGPGWLTAKLGAAAGVTVVYSRGAVSVVVTVVVGAAPEPQSQPQPTSRVVRDASTRDYLIPAGGLGALGEPRAKDTITETINGVPRVFVVAERAGEKCWRWADPERTDMRIHTRPDV